MIMENACLILRTFPLRVGETREEIPMNVMIYKLGEREARRVQASREEQEEVWRNR